MAEEPTPQENEQINQNPEDLKTSLAFQEALQALRRGDKPRAKEQLTLLLKTDQNNPVYWIWLSATVEAPKERIYCLQTALKLDPENTLAKRGLILLGALPPDETIQPFPLNRPRAWEEKLLLAHEKPKERGLRATMKSPLMRLGSLALIGLGVFVVIYFGVILPNRGTVQLAPTNTAGPSPTFTATPTIFGATAVPTQVFTGPTPLSSFLGATYTPTPLYVNTPRSAAAVDQFRIAQEAYERGDWDAFIENMLLLERVEPESADIPYYIGEAYRFKGENNTAASYYRQAVEINPDFGPAYLGLARIDLTARNVEDFFEQAIEKDPNFGEAYLERAKYYISISEIEAAMEDLAIAEKILPGSPDVYLAYANAYRTAGEDDKSLEFAQKAYAADVLNIPTYRLLGDLYIDLQEYEKAVEVLLVYTNYESKDPFGYAKLGQAYYYLGEYQSTIDAINYGTELSRLGLKRYYIYRGMAHLALGNFDDAVGDLEDAVNEDDQNFDVRLAYAQAFYGQGKFGSAFLQIEAARSLVETDEQKALELFWRGRIQKERNDTRDEIKTWQEFLALDEKLMTADMRKEAQARYVELVPPTKTPTPTKTPKGGVPTATNTVTSTPAKATATRTPSPTPTP